MRQTWVIAGLMVLVAVTIGTGYAANEPQIGTVVLKSFKGAVGTRVAGSAEPLFSAMRSMPRRR
jgi:hypothetical protein